MTNKKVRQVCRDLIESFSGGMYVPVRRDPEKDGAWEEEEAINHALYLLSQIPAYLDNGKKTKAHRHLGAAQMLLVTFGGYTVREMMNMNKPDPVEDTGKYYVMYKSYTEYNQFEGSWDLDKEEFISFEEAERWIEEAQTSSDIRDIIGPLKITGI